MSILGFGKKNVPAAQTPILNGVPVNQSGYGQFIPVAIGVNQTTMNLTGLWDFLRTTTTTPGQSVGKGIGGGGSSTATTSTTYSTAFQALLCFGYVDHIDAVWTGSGKVPVQQISTNFTVPGGGGHLDITDPGLTGDRGVGYLTSYSAAVNDFGSGITPTLAGSYLVAGKSGTTTSAGVYVVSNPSAGVTRYTFGAADAGKTVSINYTTTFTTITETAEIVIPGSATYSVPSPNTFVGNSTVNYSVTSNELFGPGDHSVAGHFSCDSTGDFTFNAGDIGQTVIITWQSNDPNVDPAATVMNWSLINGTASQSPWSYLTGRHQDAALAHPNVALVQSSDLQLGQSGAMPQLSFETFSSLYSAGAGIADCNPADVIEAILTDPIWGIGFDPSLIGDWSNARAFWQANGFFISVLQTTQTTAWDLIDQILDAGQGVRFWDSGQLQIAVYGDTSVAGNGVIFQPDTQPLVEFDLSDIIAQGGSAPVKVETEPENNIFNRVSVAFINRQNDYNSETIMEDDPASIQKYGLNLEDQQSWDFLRTGAVAQIAANMRLKRMTTIRDQYTMAVTTRYRSLLVPMKLITVTWDKMGWAQKPLRILSIEDSHTGLALTLEEFPYGVSKPTLYPKMTPQALNANPGLINPGDTDIVALEIPDLMNGFAGRTVRFYASPELPVNWGGVEIFTSDDNAAFSPLGQITAPVVFGTLGGSGMTTGTGDPDTQSITVTLTTGLQIIQPPTSDFNNLVSLLAIIDSGGTIEIVAFKNASLTGENVYTLDTFHRGLFGTTRASHSAGATIIEMGESFLEYTYPPSRDGSNLYVKAASFNKMNGRLQDLGDLSSVTIVLTGTYPGFFNGTNGQFWGSTPLNNQGSIPPNQGLVINYTFPSTSMMITTWPTQSLQRADGSTLVVNASSGTNLLVDGDGESGTLGSQATGWGNVSGNGAIVANDAVHSGSKAIKTAGGNTSINQQNVSLTGGQIYVMEGWVKSDAMPTFAPHFGAGFELSIISGITSWTIITKFGAFDQGNVTLPQVSLPADGTARPFTFLQCYLIPASNGLAALSLLNQSISGNCWFDDVKCYPYSGTISTGLSASTTYYLYPYVEVATGNLKFANGNPPTTAPSETFVLAGQSDGHIPMATIKPLTPASAPPPGGGVGGTGGGFGTCPEFDELVSIQRYSDNGQLIFVGQIKAGEVQHGFESDDSRCKRGDFLRGYSFTKKEDVYRAVQKTMALPCRGWSIVNGHRVTCCEHIYVNDQWMCAWKAPGATHDTFIGRKVLIQVEADWDDEHNYYIGDLLIHNSLILPC